MNIKVLESTSISQLVILLVECLPSFDTITARDQKSVQAPDDHSEEKEFDGWDITLGYNFIVNFSLLGALQYTGLFQ